MTRAVLLVAALLCCSGCATALDAAVVTVNGARDVGLVAHDVIRDVCVPAYQAATTVEQRQAVDRKCQPAMTAYKALAVAHARALVVVRQAQSGAVQPATVLAAVQALQQAEQQVATALQQVAP